jgi:imidazolonepropionase-like amidohydrolase
VRLTNGRLADAAGLVDLVVDDGTITDVLPASGAAGDLDLDGRLVLPGFVETHVHLDKAHLDSLETNPDGTLAGAIEVTGRLERGFDHTGVAARARVLDQAIAQRHHADPRPPGRRPDRGHPGGRGDRRPSVRRTPAGSTSRSSPSPRRGSSRHPAPST